MDASDQSKKKDSKTALLYAVLGISILGVLGVVGVVLYILLKPKTATQQASPPPVPINIASVNPATGRFQLSPYQVESSCSTACTQKSENHVCLEQTKQGVQPYYCVPDSSGNYSWQTSAQQGNSVMMLTTGANGSNAVEILSSAPAGTVLVGGPDTDMSQGAARNNENWTYWRGSDGLIYQQRLGNATTPAFVAPYADCNSWMSSDGTCRVCVDGSGNPLMNCCSCSNPNIRKMVNYTIPGTTTVTNLCQPYNVTIDSTGTCQDST